MPSANTTFPTLMAAEKIADADMQADGMPAQEDR